MDKDKINAANGGYIFTSKRLGFRNWTIDDAQILAKINRDKEVMAYFPSTQTHEETDAFIKRMIAHYHEKAFCYFAVDSLEDRRFIGFIGLMEKELPTSPKPCVDIGWRLDKNSWGKGFATEGAQRCLKFGFEDLGLRSIVSLCPRTNARSEKVMIKIGMQKLGEFEHPQLSEYERLKTCVLYEKRNPFRD